MTELESQQTLNLDQIDFVQPWPIKHLQPSGLLPACVESACLWQFLLMATQALDKVEKQTTLEGDMDQEVNLRQLADSAMKMFTLPYDSAGYERVFNDELVELAKRQAKRSGLFWDTRLDAWFASGGRSYNKMDRDADKVGL